MLNYRRCGEAGLLFGQVIISWEDMMGICRFGLLVVALGSLWGCGPAQESTSTERREGNPFPELDAYGEWIDYPGLGQVWQPRVSYDWQPFTEGRWVWTDQGWLWYSDEPFGWAVYHYGYWVNEGASGWLWVPGYDWSPARVRWVVRDDAIGWAPLPPPGRSLPVAVDARGWIVVHPRQFTQRNVGQYRGRLRQPPADPGGRDNTKRPPDVKMIEHFTNVPVEVERFETERVGRGDSKLLRVRMSETHGAERPRPGQVSTPSSPTTTPPAPVVPPAKPGQPYHREIANPPAQPSHPPAVEKVRKEPPGKKEHIRKPPPAKEPKSRKADDKVNDRKRKEPERSKDRDKKDGNPN